MPNIREAFLKSYKERQVLNPFLSKWFKTTPRDIVSAGKVKIDIMRSSSKVATVVTALSEHSTKLIRTEYTEKEFTPPKVAIGFDITAEDIDTKVFGLDPYASANVPYIADLQSRIMDKMREGELAIARNIEYQASQIFQTGKLTLQDDKGNNVYEIDYKPKTSHIVTVSTAWSDYTNSDPDKDISNLYKEILKDGKTRAVNIIFGSNAWENYCNNSKVKDKLNLRNANVGIVDPKYLYDDADYLGELLIGTNRFRCYCYEGYYTNASGKDVNFLDPDKVIMIPDSESINCDFRKIYCTSSTITGVDPRLESIIPSYMNLENRAYTIRAWLNEPADSLSAEISTRPLLIPVSLDSFGCIKTTV